MTLINKNSPIPLYYQLKELLREKIENGEMNPHERVPSETELTQMFNISRMTSRHALIELENDGLVYREQGKGTFVAEPKLRQKLPKLTGFTEDMRVRGLKAGAKVLDVQVILGDKDLAIKLGASSDEEFVKIQRVRFADDVAMAVETVFLRRKFCEGIEKIDLNNRSLYETLRTEYGIRLGRAEQILEPTLADEYEAEILGIDVGKPLLFIEGTAFLEDGLTAIEYTCSAYRGDRYRFYVELEK
ncbi:MAG: GntR family transcriptional regulator [Candidatus Bipolaricaulia bacterium]